MLQTFLLKKFFSIESLNLPLDGGGRALERAGGGDKSFFASHPHPNPPPSRGRGFLSCLSVVFLSFFIAFSAHADPSPFTKQFFKIKTFDPPVSISDVFFLQPDQQAPLQMSTLHGKWVILNVWATWCAPCMVELPKLDRLNATAVRHGDNYVVLAVSVDQKMTADRLGYYLKRAKAPGLAPLHDTVQVLSGKLDTGLLPITYIVDPNGAVRMGLYGPAEWDSDQAIQFAQNLNKYVGAQK